MLISFDIGIKNLAYCVFNKTGGVFNKTGGVFDKTGGVFNKTGGVFDKTGGVFDKTTVVDWGIINLSDSVSNSTYPLCNCQMKNGITCGKKATYTNGALLCCATHAKSCGKLLPAKELSMPHVKKLKLDDLRVYCAQKFISIGVEDKKPAIIDKVQQHLEKNVLQPIKKTVTKTANQIHLVDIGRRIKTNFDTRFSPYINNIQQVILENQISPIAGRMNTIQGMVAQYFIMKSLNVSIDFISSAGKLKGLAASSEYKDHKKNGIAFCQQFMAANPELALKKAVIDEATKKDDLADCFLQGIYYMKKQNIINYSEDLKIKSVV